MEMKTWLLWLTYAVLSCINLYTLLREQPRDSVAIGSWFAITALTGVLMFFALNKELT